MITPRIFITPGEPAGIGPDISVMIAQENWEAELIVIADPDLLSARAREINLPLRLIDADLEKPSVPHLPHSLKIIPEKLNHPVTTQVPHTKNSFYVMRTLEKAATLCQQHTKASVVTGPVNKEIINQAGIPFSGHTEFFAQCCGVEQTVMLFVVDPLKVALATTHIPLAKVASSLNQEKLERTLLILHEGLQNTFNIPNPHIFICGLNPHAGEGGYLGREEIDTLIPLITHLKAKGYHLTGPLPADTLFTPPYLKEADAILAMYHDQALPLVKYIGFGHAVNVTLGLPFIRTSVDHGTAFSIAGTQAVDPGSMRAALQLAIQLQTSKNN